MIIHNDNWSGLEVRITGNKVFLKGGSEMVGRIPLKELKRYITIDVDIIAVRIERISPIKRMN